MAINIKCTVKANFLEKWITVGKLKEILSELNDDLELLPNQVGNLSVFSPPAESKCHGVIDFSEEKFVKYRKSKNDEYGFF